MLSSLNFSGRMFHVREARTKNEFWKVAVLHLRGQMQNNHPGVVDTGVDSGTCGSDWFNLRRGRFWR